MWPPFTDTSYPDRPSSNHIPGDDSPGVRSIRHPWELVTVEGAAMMPAELCGFTGGRSRIHAPTSSRTTPMINATPLPPRERTKTTAPIANQRHAGCEHTVRPALPGGKPLEFLVAEPDSTDPLDRDSRFQAASSYRHARSTSGAVSGASTHGAANRVSSSCSTGDRWRRETRLLEGSPPLACAVTREVRIPDAGLGRPSGAGIPCRGYRLG